MFHTGGLFVYTLPQVIFGGTTILIRAFTAVPMHAAASGLMGYRIGLAKMGAKVAADPALAALATRFFPGIRRRVRPSWRHWRLVKLSLAKSFA